MDGKHVFTHRRYSSFSYIGSYLKVVRSIDLARLFSECCICVLC